MKRLAILIGFLALAFFAKAQEDFITKNEQKIFLKNDEDSKYKLIILTDDSGRKKIQLLQKDNPEGFHLDNIFSAQTKLSNYSYLGKENIKLVHFKATDLDYTVFYYWDFEAKNLHFIARDNASYAISKSEKIKTVAPLANFINAHYLNPQNPLFTQSKTEEKTEKAPAEKTKSNTENIQQNRASNIDSKIDLKNNPNNKFQVDIAVKGLNKRQVGFGEKGETLKYHPHNFTDDTDIKDFEYLATAGIELLHFLAVDYDWTVFYYWNLKTNELHYIAKGNQTGQVIRSESLKAYNPVTRYVNNHYAGLTRKNQQETNGTNGTNGTNSNTNPEFTKAINSKDIAIKISDYLNRSRIFTLTLENTKSQALLLEAPKVVLEIRNRQGFYKTQTLYTLDNLELEGFGFKTIEDNFVAEGASGQYVIYRDFEDNVTLLPPLKKGSYQLKIAIYANEKVFKSNSINVVLPLL